MNTPGKPRPSLWQRRGFPIVLGVALVAVVVMLFARW